MIDLYRPMELAMNPPFFWYFGWSVVTVDPDMQRLYTAGREI